MIATKGNFPKIGKVISITDNSTLESDLEVEWYIQERAAHKPRWLRYFHPSKKQGHIKRNYIILYDFELTKKGALKI